MKMTAKRWPRLLAALTIIAVLAGSLPCVALAESFAAVVISDEMVVAADAAGKLPLGTLKRNTVVTVKAHKKGVAKIEYKGRTGYARVEDLESVQSSGEKAVTAVATRVYKKSNATGASKKIKAGTSLNVLAVKNGVAQVEKNGAVGYVKRKNLLMAGDASGEGDGGMTREQLEKLKKELEAQQKGEQQEKAPSIKDAFTSGKYSNEQLCFLFLTKGMGYNTAAAAGVLANINYESGFKTTCVGDGGTSTGICQWHAERKTRLTEYCKQHGAKVDSLAAQLAFLKYELETFYPAVHKYLKGVSNDAEGAYKAGYYFCYNFEAPAARTSQSEKRASSAKSTYYPRYAKI